MAFPSGAGVEVAGRGIEPIVPWLPNSVAAANRTNSMAAVITNPSELARSSSSPNRVKDDFTGASAPALSGLPSRCSGSLARSLPTFSPKLSPKPSPKPPPKSSLKPSVVVQALAGGRPASNSRKSCALYKKYLRIESKLNPGLA